MKVQIYRKDKTLDKSKNLIAGNNMLFQRNQIILPKYWPAYYKKTNGCKVIDLNGNSYFDLSLMGVGTNILRL